MNEQIVKVMATALSETSGTTVWKERAGYILAALENAGYAWFRPDECQPIEKHEEFIADQESWLVPIEGDS